MSKTNDATAAAKYGFFCQSWVKLGSKIRRDTSFFTSTAPLFYAISRDLKNGIFCGLTMG